MSSITSIFHPVLAILADLIQFFYGLVPDYSFAIAALTIVVYLALTPLLVKQTRSMIQMQKLQPEIKKLQQKYKGKDMESKQNLQQEMMALYKEHGVNPMGGCLPMVVQLPVLFVMYAVIRGLLNRKTIHAHPLLVNGLPVADPKYISHSSALYHDLVAAHGKMLSVGMDLSQAASSHHSSFAGGLPYYALVLGAAGLSLLQLQQMTIRNRKIMEQTAQMRQMQRMQLVTPLIMTFIYWKLPVALSVYFIASSVFRIAQQEFMYRFDPVLVAHVDAAIAKQPGAGKKSPAGGSKPAAGAKGSMSSKTGSGEKLAPAGSKEAPRGEGKGGKAQGKDSDRIAIESGDNPEADKKSELFSDDVSESRVVSPGVTNGNTAIPPRGRGIRSMLPSALQGQPSRQNNEILEEEAGAQQASRAHPRSRSKRPRKAR